MTAGLKEQDMNTKKSAIVGLDAGELALTKTKDGDGNHDHDGCK
jgi:hypothetical protein